jgi:hypothetical protein
MTSIAIFILGLPFNRNEFSTQRPLAHGLAFFREPGFSIGDTAELLKNTRACDLSADPALG